MKMVLGLFLGVFLAVSMVGCDDGSDGTGGTAGTGGSEGGTGGSEGGTGGTGGSTGGSGGTGGSASSLTCKAYCDAVKANCTGDLAQYGSDTSCMAVCATFPIGTEADMSGNTLGCHTYHGGAPAAGMPGTHCPHAGPLGAAVCGTSDCDNFCTVADSICGTHASMPYATKDACMTACAAFPGTAMVPYNAAATAGDSLACRMYHLTVASESDANKDVHCPHIAAVSDTCK